MDRSVLITSSEAANLLGISIYTFYRFEKLGYITPTQNTSYKRLYLKSDVDKMLERLTLERDIRKQEIAYKRAKGSYIYENRNGIEKIEKTESIASLSNEIPLADTATTIAPANSNNKNLLRSGLVSYIKNLAIVEKVPTYLKNIKNSFNNSVIPAITNKKQISTVFSQVRNLATQLKLLKSFRKQILLPFSMGIILILIPAAYLILRHAEDVGAWYDDNWNYRVRYTINNTGSSDSNKKILIEIDTESLISDGKMQEDCGDSGFVTINGLVLKYYIDEAGGACNTSSTNYWVLIPTIHQGETVIYHYYGNRTAADGTQAQQFTQDTFDPDSVSMGSEETGPGPVAYWKMDEGYGEGQGAFIEQEINIMDQEYVYHLDDYWWDYDWQYRIKITFDNSNSSEDLIDFPVLVKLSPSIVDYSKIQSNGEDIRFVQNIPVAEIPYEIEKWDSTAESYIWVKVSIIPGGSIDSYIYMYYNNPTVSDNQSPTEVWDSNYIGVWHLNEESGTDIFDSTGNLNHGTKTSTNLPAPTSEGQVGSAHSFDGTNQAISIPNNATFNMGNHMTLEAWIKPTNCTTRQTIIGRQDQSSVVQLEFGSGTCNVGTIINGTYVSYTSSNTLTAGEWNHVVYTRNGTGANHKIYVNGTERSLSTNATNNYANPTGPFELGRRTAAGGQRYTGILDEVRMSNIPRSGSWVNAQYLAMTDNYNSFGSNEDLDSYLEYLADVPYAPTDNNLGIIQYNPTKYNSPNLFFEVVFSFDGLNWETVRSEQLDPFNLTKELTVRAKPGNKYNKKPKIQLYNITDSTSAIEVEVGTPSDTSIYIRSAKLKIAQKDSTAISTTQTQIEVGSNEQLDTHLFSDPYQPLDSKKIYIYNSASYNPIPKTSFEATIKAEPQEVRIEQQIDFVNLFLYELDAKGDWDWVPKDNSLGSLTWDETKYPGASIYFEAIIAGGSYLNNVGARMYDTNGGQVQDAFVSISTGGGDYTRLRSSAISLNHNTTYTVRIASTGYSVNQPTNPYIKAARLIIIQSDPEKITSTRTQVEIGNTDKISESTPTSFEDKKIYYYDSSKFSPAPTAYFEAFIRNSQPTIEQHINIMNKPEYFTSSTSYVPLDNSLGLIKWEEDKYPNSQVYFEAVLKSHSHTGRVWAALYTKDGQLNTTISYQRGLGGSRYLRIRSDNPINLSDGVEYTARVRSDGTNYSISIKSARLIVIQSDSTKITETQTNIDIGSFDRVTSTSPTQLTDQKIYYYDATKFSPAPTAYFEASIHGSQPTVEQNLSLLTRRYTTTNTAWNPTDNSLGIIKWEASKYPGATVYFEAVLRNNHHPAWNYFARAALYTTAGSEVSNSEVLSNSESTYIRVRSDALTLFDGQEYTLRVRTSHANANADVMSARLIIIQTDLNRITSTQAALEIGGTERITGATPTELTDKKIYYYDSSRFSPAPSAYFEASLRASQPTIEQHINIINRTTSQAGTSYAPTDNSLGIFKWEADKYSGATVHFEAVIASNSTSGGRAGQAALFTLGGSIISSTVVSTNSTSYTRVRSAAINLSDGLEYTVRVRNEHGSQIGYVRAARLIVVQTDPTRITETQSIVEIGNNENTNQTSYSQLTDRKIYYYDSSRFSPAPTAYFEASIRAAEVSQSIIEQQINIINRTFSQTGTTYGPTDNSLGLFRWETDKYSGASVYFEAVIRTNHSNSGREGWAALFTSDGEAVSGSGIATNSTSFVRIRSGTLSLADGVDYTVRVRNQHGSYTGFILAAKLIIVQQVILANPSRIETTQTSVEVGNNETTTATSYTQLTNKKIYYYDATKFKPEPTAYFEASLSNNTEGEDAFAALYENGSSCTNMVSGSEVSVTGTSWSLARSNAITLNSGTEYMVCIRSSSGTARIANAKILLHQYEGNGIEDLETYHYHINTLTTRTTDTYADQDYISLFNPNSFMYESGNINYFFEATMRTTAGTSYAMIRNLSDGTDIASSEITSTSTSYERVRSSDITVNMPSANKNLDTRIRNSAASGNTTSVSSSMIVIQISNLTFHNDYAYAELYNLTDGVSVSGSEIATPNPNWFLYRSPAITLASDKEYVVRIRTNNASYQAEIQNAKIILHQQNAGGITALETLQHHVNTLATHNNATPTSQSFATWYNPDLQTANRSFAGGTVEYFYEATMKTSAGTGSARLTLASAASTINTTNSNYERVRTTNAITSDLPLFTQSTGSNIDTQLFTTSGTVSASSSWIVIQISNLATNGVTVYAELYNITDATTVSGSEISTTSNNVQLIRSSDFSLLTNKEYVIRTWGSHNYAPYYVYNAKLILHQQDNDGITALETYQQQVNFLGATTGNSYVSQNRHAYYNPDIDNVQRSFAGGLINYFFEATMKTSANTGFAILRNVTDSLDISGSEISTTSNDYTRIRSGNITNNLPVYKRQTGTDMDTRIRNSESSGSTTSISSSMLVIQITDLATNGITAYADLYNLTDGEVVSGSEVTTNLSEWTLVRSAPISLLSEKEYVARIRTSFEGIPVTILNAKILLHQQDINGITDIETYQQQVVSVETQSNNSYTAKDNYTQFNPDTETIGRSFGGGTLNYYFEANLRTTGGGTAQARLLNYDFGQIIANSEVSTVNTSYTRVRTANITDNMPTYPSYGRYIDVQLRNTQASGHTTSVSNTWIIIQISDLSTNGVITYTDLYNVTDGIAVPNSEISTTSTQWELVRSPALTLTTEKEYAVRMRTSHQGAAVHMQNARLILDQEYSGGITALETIQRHVNTAVSRSASSYAINRNFNITDKNSFRTGDLSIYYEANMKTSAGTGFAMVRNTSDSNDIASSEITTTSTNYERIRSGEITDVLPNTTKEFDTQIRNSSTDTTRVSNSQMVVQISNLGNVTAYAALYENGSACTNMVSGSEVSFLGTPGNYDWARVRTGANITLDNLKEYMVCTKASPGGRVLISNAKVIHDQTSDLGVTSVELYHTLNNTFVTHNNTTYENRNYPVRFDPSNFHDIYEISYEATIKTDSGTGYTQLYDKTGETAITDTELLTTSTSYERLKTSDIYPNLSSDPSDIDLQIKSSSTNVTSVSGSYLVIRANGISTAILNDSTANRHNGTLNGGTWKSEADCKFGGCIYWDGISNHSEVTHSRKLDFKANDSFTISTWIKRAKKDTDNPTTDVILAKYESVGSDGGYKLYMNPDGTITFGVSDTNSVFPKDSVSSTTSYDDNFWHHVVAIKDGTSSMLLYIDLDLVDIEDTITSGNLSNNDSLFIAIDGDGVSNPFNGHLDEMKIFPYARSFDEIQMEYLNGAGSKGNSISFGGRDLSPLGDGLIGYWKMDEAQAGTCSPTGDSCDSSGNYLNASWIGNPTSAKGKFGNALSLGGTNDAALIGTLDWYNVGQWSNRMQVTFNNSDSSEDLVDFPVLVKLDATRIDYSKTQSNGEDIRFTASDGTTLLSHEIESWDSSGESFIWVKIPNIPAGSTTDYIYMYYNNPNAPDGQDAGNVWDNNYKMVHHFSENSGTLVYDSTFNSFVGTKLSATEPNPTTSGKIGGGRTFDGVNDFIASANTTVYQNFTIEAWIKPGTTNLDLQEIVSKRSYYATATTDFPLALYLNPEGTTATVFVDRGNDFNADIIVTSDPFSNNEWHHIAATYDGSTLTLYIDGVGKSSSGLITLSNNTRPWTFGRSAFDHSSGSGRSPYNGLMDEVRISNSARTSNWINASYKSGNDNFSIYGGEEAYSNKLEGYWEYRTPLTISNSSASALNNYQVRLNVTYESGMKADFSDIRFTSADGITPINYWIESKTDSVSAMVWVKIPSVPPTGSTDIYLYYGNIKAKSASNGDGVFIFFDDFSKADVIDSVKWSNNFTPSFYSISNGIITLRSDGSAWRNMSIRPQIYTSGTTSLHTTEMKYRTGGVNTLHMIYNQSNSANRFGILPFYTSSAGPRVQYRINSGSYVSKAVYATAPVNNWYIHRIDRVSSTQFFARSYNSSYGLLGSDNHSSASWAISFEFGLHEQLNVQSLVDWVRIREYAATEPTASFSGDIEMYQVSLNEPTENITISAWVNASTLDGSSRAIVSRGDSPSEDWYVKASGDNPGKISFSADGGTNVGLSNTTLLTGNWYHILMSAGEGRTKLYVNGVLDSETDFSGVIPTEGDLGIGNNPSGGTGWHGLIDDVRLYNKVLTDSDVFNLFKWAEGPIAYWNFDEGAGTTAYDRSGNVRHGTLTNGPRWSEGKFGKAVSLDGVNDHIRVFHNPDFDITDTSSITISGWFNRDTFNTNDTIIAKKNSTSLSDIGYMIYIDSSSDKLNFLISDGTNEYRMVSERAFTQNGWNHFVVTFDPLSEDSSRIYINGSNDNATKTGTLSSLGDSSNELNLIIGSQSNISNPFGGKIDDIKIHNHILRVDQIIEEMNAGHPPVGTPVSAPMIHLKFDEGYGNIAHDSTIHENHGNLAGSGTTCPQEGASACPSWINDGRFGKALRFDGDDYVDLGNPDSLGFREAMTISFWINTSSYGSGSSLNSRIISKNGSAGSSGWEMYIDGTTNKMVFSLSSELSLINQVQSVGDVPLDEWMQYTGVYIPGEALKIYVNGVLDSTQEGAPPSITNNSNSIWIGGRPECANCFFEGDIDDLKIYNYALDDSQIALDHNKGMAVSIGSSGTTPQGRPSDSASSEYCVPGDSSYCAPPVSEWRLSENHGTIINDTSGNNNFGTLINNPLWSRAIFGSGLDLDGFEAYVQINDTGTLDLSTDYTISAWVYPRDLGSNAVGAGQTIYANWKDSNASPTGGVMFGIGGSGTPLTGMVKLEHRGGSSLVGSSCCAITPNKWQFLTATMSEANTYRIYLNNLFSNGATLSTITADFTDASPKIGRAHHSASTANPYESFNGMVGRILIYDYPRTPAQIAWDFNKGGPIAWYKFDECEGTTLNNSAYDPSGAKGNNASLVIGSGGTNTLAGSCNSGSSQSSWNKGTDGKRNSSIHLDGTDDHAQTANHLLIASNNRVYSNVSWGAWVRADATQVSKTILQRGSTSNAAQQEFRLTTNSLGHAQCEIYTSEWLAPVTSTLPLPSGEWTSVICTYDGTSTKIYVNGIMDNSFSQTGNITSRATHAINIGRSAVDNTGHFQGSIDDLKIWPYALTNPLILREYSDGAVSFGD
jgi:hypothetical protein